MRAPKYIIPNDERASFACAGALAGFLALWSVIMLWDDRWRSGLLLLLTALIGPVLLWCA